MGPVNAFTNGLAHDRDHDDERPPAKRVRLSEDVIASIHHHTAGLETSLEVDHMILDYVAHNTVEACLSSRGYGTQIDITGLLPSRLSMSDSFLAIFKARHPDFQPDAELRFRILLLKFTTLFTQRLTSNPTTPSKDELQQIREANSERARSWLEGSRGLSLAESVIQPFAQELPMPRRELERNRAHVLQQLDIPPEEELYEDPHYGTSACMSLLDLTPTFMQLSAAQCTMGYSNLTMIWMHLAVELMLQACLEQYLVYGAHGLGALAEAFAWGYKGSHENLDAKEGAVNDMFEDQDYETEAEGWNALRTSFQKMLLPTDSEHQSPTDAIRTNGDHESGLLAAHLEDVAGDHPTARFEASMLEFLRALSHSIPAPVLAQLEKGCLDGMTQEQTAGFLTDCGVDVATFFSDTAGFKELFC